MNLRPMVILVSGAAVSFVAMLVRLNARDIAWPDRASWGAQVEATPFYATQLAIADISSLFMAFGLVLVAAVVIHELFAQKQTAEPEVGQVSPEAAPSAIGVNLS